MPIKPPRRPGVSSATGRPTGETRDRDPSSDRAPHGRDPYGHDPRGRASQGRDPQGHAASRADAGPGARPAARSAPDDWRGLDERRPASAASDAGRTPPRQASYPSRASDDRRPGAAASGAGRSGAARPAPSRSGPRPESRDFGQRPVLAADRPAALYLSCPSGVESLLATEARRILGEAAQIHESRGGIEVLAPATAAPAECQQALRDYAMRLNLESRLAQRVLWRVATRVYRHEDDIYVLARSVNWSDWITPQHTLRVDVVSRRSHLQSLNFAGLRVKDAVCDDLRERTGERPSVDTRFPDLGLVLYLDDLDAILYVDTSGEALFKRGWREDTGEAPLKETLAAAMLAAADWQGRPEDGALLDPCCGAGTIPIEAAQIACGIAPALQRPVPCERGVLMFNPPYGERIDTKGSVRNAYRARSEADDPMGEDAPTSRAGREQFQDDEAATFFQRLSSHWKKQYPGWTAWILSPDMKLPSAMRLKESRRVVMFNGPIECRLFRFDLVAGSNKPRAAAPTDTELPPSPSQGD